MRNRDPRRQRLAEIQVGFAIAAVGAFLVLQGTGVFSGSASDDSWMVRGAVIALVGVVIFGLARRS